MDKNTGLGSIAVILVFIGLLGSIVLAAIDGRL